MTTKPCPSCAAELFADDDFCPKCGAILDESLLASDELFGPKTEPSFALPPPPVSEEAPTFDHLLEELTGTFQVIEAAHVMFAEVSAETRVDPDALTRLSSVLAVRAGADATRVSLSPYEKIVLSLLNGNRSVARVAKKSGLGAVDVQRAIGVLAERGLIELRGELQPDVRGMLLGEIDDDDEGDTVPHTVPKVPAPLAAVPRTMPAVALLDSFSEELTAELKPDEDLAPPPVEEAPVPAPARATPRFSGDRAVNVRAGREELGALWVSNLSKGGLFVESDTPPPAYTSVDITIDTPDGSLSLRGEVVHVQLPGGAAPAGAGIQLAPIAADVRERLENYLKGLAPLGGPSGATGADPARLESALAAARTLSNGIEASDPYAALGLIPGCTRDVVEARVREVRALLEGPHPGATPPQAARCTNALRHLQKVVDELASLPAPPPTIPPEPLPVPTAEPAYVSAPAAASSVTSSIAEWTSSAPAASVPGVPGAIGVPGVPGVPSVPGARAAAPVAHAPAARQPAPPPAAPAAPAAPANDPRRMRAMQLLESAVKELRAGKRTGALTYIRMAAEIAPDDPQVKALLSAWTGKG